MHAYQDLAWSIEKQQAGTPSGSSRPTCALHHGERLGVVLAPEPYDALVNGVDEYESLVGRKRRLRSVQQRLRVLCALLPCNDDLAQVAPCGNYM